MNYFFISLCLGGAETVAADAADTRQLIRERERDSERFFTWTIYVTMPKKIIIITKNNNNMNEHIKKE